MDSPDLLEHIKLRVADKSLRHNQLFVIESHRTSYGKYKPLNRMCSWLIYIYNFSAYINFFRTNTNSINSIKSILPQYLVNI